MNLYDFESALAKGLKPREAIEEIDIGGPVCLRGVQRTSTASFVLSDPDTYAPWRELRRQRTFRRRAWPAQPTSRYDAMIAEYLTKN